MKRRTIRKIIVVVLAVGVGFPLYKHWAAEKEYEYTKDFFYSFSELILGRADENSIKRGAGYADDLNKWNETSKQRFNQLYSNYRRESGSPVNQSIDIAGDLIDQVYTLRNETVPYMELLYSERMLDPKTLKNEDEYRWRIETLDGITAYKLGYKKRVLKICEGFRQEVVTSDLPDEYRVYIWDKWADNIHDYITKLGPQVDVIDNTADSYKRLFHFMHEYSKSFYINDDGKVIFTDSRHVLQYQSLLFASGITNWTPS